MLWYTAACFKCQAISIQVVRGPKFVSTPPTADDGIQVQSASPICRVKSGGHHHPSRMHDKNIDDESDLWPEKGSGPMGLLPHVLQRGSKNLLRLTLITNPATFPC